MRNWPWLASMVGWSLGTMGLALAQAQEQPVHPSPRTSDDAQEVNDYEELDLDRLLNSVFSASKHEQDIADSPSAITVITREQIENSYCSSVTCLLRLVPEMEVVAQKPMFTTVGARSNSHDIGEHTLALVDGREINLELFGAPPWEMLPVHVEDIERIEVIRGPGSALYGANAYSAVVSITTRKATRSGESIFLGAGEKNSSNLHLRVDQLLGDFRLQLSASRESNNSYMIRGLSERGLVRLRTRVDYLRGGVDSFVELGWTGFDGSLSADAVQFWAKDGRTAYAIASVAWGRWQAKVWFNLIDLGLAPDFSLEFGSNEIGKMPSLLHMLATTVDADVQGSFELFKDNLLLIGGNYRWLRFACPQNNPDEVNQHRMGFFAQDEQRISDFLLLNGSVRLDLNTKTPLAFSPRLAAVLKFSEDQRLRLAVGQAFRKPSFFNSSIHVTGVEGIAGLASFIERSMGNERLDNESITVYEIGYLGRFLKRQLTLEAGLFYNQYRNGIIFATDIKTNSLGAPDLAQSSMGYVNDGRLVNSVGGSIALTYRLREVFLFGANYTYRNTSYSDKAATGLLLNNALRGDSLVWEPAHLYNLFLQFSPDRGPSAGIGFSGRSAITWWLKGNGSPFNPWGRYDYPANTFISVFASWRFLFYERSAEIGLRATNLVNSDYQDIWSQTRTDGTLLGSERPGRMVLLFLRGVL